MKCPRCKIGLSLESLAGLELDRCPSCKGVWLDPGEGEPLTRPDAQVPIELVRKAASDRYQSVTADAQLTCPRCDKTMQRERYAKSLVNIDRCACGVWLDGGEVEKIQAYRNKKLMEISSDGSTDRAKLEATFARIYFDAGKRKP